MIEWLFGDFDFSRIHIHVVWLVLTYCAVLFAMFIDLITGLRKAKQAGIATTSRLLKKSCDKAIKYFFPMLCLMPVDFMTAAISHVYSKKSSEYHHLNIKKCRLWSKM